jgi:Na+/H+ antiporter NhaD/arsenite permease-like protein
MTGALVVFVLTYLVIAGGQLKFLKLDRPGAAVVGAAAMVIVGGLPMDDALHAIDLHVVILLFGVLVIAAYLQRAQFFRYVAYAVLTRTRSARTLLFGLTFVAGGLSALLVNDTVCIVLTPLVIAVVVETRLPALPYLLALTGAANVGGVVSFSGNPQNMIVGAAARGTLGFAQYFAIALPIGIACLAASAAMLSLLFRKQLRAGVLGERTMPKPALDKPLAIKALAALALFAVLAIAGVELSGAAMAAAATLMLAARNGGRDVIGLVDWTLLAFFGGLFIVVAGLEHAGVLDRVLEVVSPMIGRGDWIGELAFVALIVIGSQLVSNVPLVIIAVHWIPKLPNPAWGFSILAIVSTLAGNLTLFGSMANIIVLEAAGPRGEIGFLRFLRYGALITLVELAIAFGILWLERAIGMPGWLGLR